VRGLGNLPRCPNVQPRDGDETVADRRGGGVGSDRIGLRREPVGRIVGESLRPVAARRHRDDLGRGEFTVTGLAPGRYFLTTIGRAAFTIGFAVVAPSPGASVVLVGCTDCPLPQ